MNDSYGAGKVLGWLFTGGLFDHERFPIVTLLFFAGVVVCAVRARHDLRARALLGAFALSLLLFFGRPTLGPLLDLLPGFKDVQIHRFVMGVHLAGIMLAGVGLAWLAPNGVAVGGPGHGGPGRTERVCGGRGGCVTAGMRRCPGARLDRARRLRPARSHGSSTTSGQPRGPTAATSTGSSRW